MFKSIFSITKVLPVNGSSARIILSQPARLVSQDHSEPDSYEYFVLNENHGDEVERFMFENFFPREPMNIACGSDRCTDRPYIKSVFVPSGVSLGARNPNTGALVGVVLNTVLDRGQKFGAYDHSHITHPGMRRLCKLMTHLLGAYDVFRDPSIKKILDLGLLGIPEEHSNQGLGAKLTKMSEELGKAKGCQLATGQAMNPISMKLLTSHGYEEAYSVNCHDLVLDGEKVFKKELIPLDAKFKVFIKNL